MTYCPGCGSEVEDDWSHCTECGEALSTSAAESASQHSAFPTGRKLTLGGLVLVAVGAFLPWVSTSVLGTSDSVIGINTFGVVTLVLAAVAGFLVLLSRSTGVQTLALLAGIGIAGVAAIGISDPVQLVEVQVSGLDEGLIHADNGLYATLVGGIIVVFANGYAIQNEGQRPADDEEEDPSFFTLYWLPWFSE